MIVKIINKEGTRGSGGAAEAFKPGARYVCEKADYFEMRNLAADDWLGAATEMKLVSELNSRVQKPYYHMATSWHAHEQPTNAQVMEAADYLIKAMGLEEHQAIIAIHEDKKQKHFHVMANTVHPLTGKVWSKSNDQRRAEKACREIEIMQGWSHDRGRFDFDVAPDGTVTLKPNPKAYAAKKAKRAKGKRPKTSGARKFEKSTGFETFEHSLNDALRARFAGIVANAADWSALHASLAEIGLRYDKHGSGARVALIGSREYVKASAFGAKFSFKELQMRFGPFEAPLQQRMSAPEAYPAPVAAMAGRLTDTARKRISASSFKITLMRRVYCDIFVDPVVAQAIKYVALDEVPPRLTLKDKTTIRDHGAKVTTSGNSKEARAIMIAMAQAKGWSGITFKGSAAFVRDAALDAARAGLPVFDVPKDIQDACNKILAKRAEEDARVAAAAGKANAAVQAAVADRDAALTQNNAEREQHTPLEDETAPILRGRTDRRRVSNPQPAPDADKIATAKLRRISKALQDNDRSELDRMKAVHIDEIASHGGWTYAQSPLGKQTDPNGLQKRTYRRGSERITATRQGSIWVWKNNTTEQSGSVIDLWLSDNPGSTLGDARKAFRTISGADSPSKPLLERPQLERQEARDHTQARRRWEEAPYVANQRSYPEELGVSQQTLLRFRNQVRADACGGIYFAHRDIQTGHIKGFEQAWKKDGLQNATKFAKGGVKSVSVLGDPAKGSRMVMFEDGLDALALAELENRADTLYVSTGGGLSPRTEAALQRLSQGRQVLSGFNNNPAGEMLHQRLAAHLPTAQRHAPPSYIAGSERLCTNWLEILDAIRSQGPTEILSELPERPENGISGNGVGDVFPNGNFEL